jgi:hypothetical protein
MANQPFDPLKVPLELINVASVVNMSVFSAVPASSELVSIKEKKWFKSFRVAFGISTEGHSVDTILDDIVEMKARQSRSRMSKCALRILMVVK